MIFREPLEAVIRRRYSVRTYSKKPIPKQVKEEIEAYIKSLSSPFPAKPSFALIETVIAADGAKLGTYGMIKGASVFIVSQTPEEAYAVEALGYEFQKLILFLTTLGLGTCWLGGTFNRAEFSKALGESEETLIPAISPVGYFERKGLRENLIRGLVCADSRKPWEELFFDGGFHLPLTKEKVGPYAVPLEMVHRALYLKLHIN